MALIMSQLIDVYDEVSRDPTKEGSMESSALFQLYFLKTRIEEYTMNTSK